MNCEKSVQIRSYFWSEYRKIRTRKNSVFEHSLALRSGVVWNTRVIDNISLKEYQKRIQNPAKHLTRSFSAKTNRPLFIFAKSSSLDVWLGSENNASDLRTSHEKGIILVIYEYSAQRCMTTANIWDGDLCKSSSSAKTPLTICKIFHLRWSRKRWIS